MEGGGGDLMILMACTIFNGGHTEETRQSILYSNCDLVTEVIAQVLILMIAYFVLLDATTLHMVDLRIAFDVVSNILSSLNN